MRLILARHGNTFEAGQTPIQVGARTDLSLTAEGKIQAQALANYVRQLNPAAVFAGALKRQIEMAQPLGVVQVEAALTEIDYGLWEGLTTEEIKAGWPTEYTAWNLGKWPDGIFGNTYEWHRQRIDDWLRRLQKQYAEKTVVGVTSNGIIRLFHPGPKVKTGHFCELLVLTSSLEVKQWNAKP